MIPYGHQIIDNDDIEAVVNVLKSNYLTTGPKVDEFEQVISTYVGTNYGIAVSSGTAALHCAMHAIGIVPGDEVIVPPITFAATANCVCLMGGKPIFSDVDPNTLLIDPDQIAKKISPKTKAIIGVDYAGQPCDWDRLRDIANIHGLALVADSCHAIGAEYKGRKVGTLADMTVFSFHPVKHVATGEGGMVVTDNPHFSSKIRIFRNHGISKDAMQREKTGEWFYKMIDLGYNYRITDIQCALGISQLSKQKIWLTKRKNIASTYDNFFTNNALVTPLSKSTDCAHAYHLYVVQVNEDSPYNRNELFSMLRNRGIGVNVHYIPVYLHPYYENQFGYQTGLCPIAEKAADRILSIPIFPGLSDRDRMKILLTFEELEKELV